MQELVVIGFQAAGGPQRLLRRLLLAVEIERQAVAVLDGGVVGEQARVAGQQLQFLAAELRELPAASCQRLFTSAARPPTAAFRVRPTGPADRPGSNAARSCCGSTRMAVR